MIQGVRSEPNENMKQHSMIQGVSSEPKENMKDHCFDIGHLLVLQDAQMGKKFS